MKTDTIEFQQHTEPFRHWIWDQAYDPAVLNEVLATWPAPEYELWHKYDAEHELGKRQLDRSTAWSGPQSKVLMWMQVAVRDTIERLTGERLIANPYGGGLHDIEPGGYLDLHVDFNIHPELKRVRRYNALLFLNDGYSSEQQGNLMLQAHGVPLTVNIEPVFNRLVVFEVGEGHWHGHPAPWCGTQHRRSLAMYYYHDAPADQRALETAHSTTWL